MRRLIGIGLFCGASLLLVQQSIGMAESAVTVPPAARETAAAIKDAATGVLEQEQAAAYRTNAEDEVKKSGTEAEQASSSSASAAKNLSQAEADAKESALAAEQAAQASSEAQNNAADLAAAADAAQQEAADAEARASAIDAQLQAAADAQEQEAMEEPETEEEASDDTAAWSEPSPSVDDGDTDALLQAERQMREAEDAYGAAERRARSRHVVLPEKAPAPVPRTSKTVEVDWSEADDAYAKAADLSESAEDASAEAEAADEAAEAASESYEAAADQAAEDKQAVLDGRLALADAEKYKQEAAAYHLEAKDALAKLIYDEEHPKPVHSWSTEMDIYQWQGGNGRSGYQVVVPITAGYWQKDLSWYIGTNLVSSHNNSSGRSGSVQTMTDTTFSIMKRNEKPKYIVDYLFDVNIPTGKSALSWSERYARMNEDIVGKSTFGEGWKFTPGIDLTRKIGKEDRWTIGLSYSFNRPYDPTSDIANDTVSPGNGVNGHLLWQHAGQTWQMRAEVLYSAAGQSSVSNGGTYRSNSQWQYRLTYNKPVSKTDDWMLYYWRENRDVDTATDRSQAAVNYLGTMYSHRIGKAHTLRYTFDVMQSNGRIYDGVYNYFDTNGAPQYSSVTVDGRRKFTLGLGYDIQVNRYSTLSLDLQAFKMYDGPSSDGLSDESYQGFCVLARYVGNF